VGGNENELSCHSRLLNQLNPFAVEIRYPGDLPQFAVTEARQLQEATGGFRKAILSIIRLD
jgi:hypothetical protein